MAAAFRPPLSTHDLRWLSLICSVDEKTLLKAMCGVKVSALPRERIERTLREAGLAHLLPSPIEGSDATRH
jgi:hypothetical protein